MVRFAGRSGAAVVVSVLVACPLGAGAAMPAWLKQLETVTLPSHDDEADAVQLLDEKEITLQPDGGQRVIIRRAYRILRRTGQSFGIASATYLPGEKVVRMNGWSQPQSGKPYEVGIKDAIESALVPGAAALISDGRVKLLEIPASNPGSIVGYEIEQIRYPEVAGEQWTPQRSIPVMRARYRLKLPQGWSFNATWIHAPVVAPVVLADGASQWEVEGLMPIVSEANSPLFETVAGTMYVAIQAPEAGRSSFRDWNEMGRWFAGLIAQRNTVTAEVAQVATSRTEGSASQLDRIKALSEFVQKGVRYVQVALGTSGYQPRAPLDVLKTGYGDCKDKANYLRLLLQQIGVESHLVLVNTNRGFLREDSPPGRIFDHAVIAVRLPHELPASATSGMAMISDGSAGSLLLFDPTDDLTPFGRVGVHLRGNRVLLVTGDSARLVVVPAGEPADNGVDRIVTMRLGADGSLAGDVQETWRGAWASYERARMSASNQNSDLTKPVEWRLAGSIANYQIGSATVTGLAAIEQPYEWRYSFTARNYAKSAGDLLLVRPRVLGVKADAFLETGKARRNPVSFEATHIDHDTMRIELPPDYEVDTLPEAVDLDVGIAMYRSRTRVEGNTLVYERSFEQKELELPLNKVEALRDFYSAIDRDERAMAVLKKRKKT